MNSNELDLINKRFDDLRSELKSDLLDIKALIRVNTEHYRITHIDCNKRISVLEHFRTKIIGITSGVSLIVGLLVGRGLS